MIVWRCRITPWEGIDSEGESVDVSFHSTSNKAFAHAQRYFSIEHESEPSGATRVLLADPLDSGAQSIAGFDVAITDFVVDDI